MIDWPKIPVLPVKNYRGINYLGDEGVSNVDMVSLKEALETEWGTDAHMLCYALKHDETDTYADSDGMVRVNKPAANSLYEAGFSLMQRIMCVDLDLPSKGRWDEETFEQFGEAFGEAMGQDELLTQWHAFYSTRGGCRLVYALDEAMPSEPSEATYRGILYRLSQTALKPYVDTSVFDWTRLFRLPKVVRDGIKTSEHPMFTLTLEDRPLFDTKSVAPIFTAVRKYGKIVKIETDQPDPDEAKALLTVPSETTGNPVMSDWYKRARKQLKGRESADLIDGKLFLEDWPDGRNNGLRFCVGQAVTLLYLHSGTDPKLIYALFVDACEQLEARNGDDDGKSWLDVLWHLVKHCWEKESAQVEQEDLAREREALAVAETSSDIMTNMRKWCSNDQLHDIDPVAMAWVSQHSIVSWRGQYYVLRQDGYYDRMAVSQQNLISRIRELGMTGVIPITEDVVQLGNIVRKDIPAQRIINKHVTNVDSASGIVGTPGSLVRDLGTDSATLMFKMYSRRTDITPQWSDEVDAWMRAMFGEFYDMAKHWIAHALNFEGGGICALSINGPPAIGKKLLVEGLAECIDTQTTADAIEMTGRFQSQALKTPFLVVNEGMPKGSREGHDPADTFRSWVTGDGIQIEEKGKGIIKVHNPMRIIVTANNDGVLQQLYHHRDLSRSDREALGRRILHMDLDAGGATWLRTKGSMQYTANEKRRWIRGDAGQQSHFVVARHFLALHQHRLPVPAGNRLLVEGDPNSEIVRDMAVSSGGSPEIIEVIVRMLEESTPPIGITTRDGHVLVTAVAVRDFHQLLFNFDKKIALARIGSVLRALSPDKTSYSVNMPGMMRKVRAWRIEPSLLMRHAENHGHPCERLRELVESTP